MKVFRDWREKKAHVQRVTRGKTFSVNVHIDCGTQVQEETGVDGGWCSECQRYVYDITDIVVRSVD